MDIEKIKNEKVDLDLAKKEGISFTLDATKDYTFKEFVEKVYFNGGADKGKMITDCYEPLVNARIGLLYKKLNPVKSVVSEININALEELIKQKPELLNNDLLDKKFDVMITAVNETLENIKGSGGLSDEQREKINKRFSLLETELEEYKMGIADHETRITTDTEKINELYTRFEKVKATLKAQGIILNAVVTQEDE
ncbi:MAG: hypothetical protein PHT91_01340 [Candidatus Nanoarchaeia archaeon]|nr:hypothetical protein [Candidatus Nanoarchaeia archaeon]